jgi:hypothetical protein
MINSTSKKIENVQAEIPQLKNKEKLLMQKHKAEERKARTHRFCKRHGYLESKIPELAKMTDEQFYTYVENKLL